MSTPLIYELKNDGRLLGAEKFRSWLIKSSTKHFVA